MSFRIASKQAMKSPHTQHKLGAVIVKGHRILSTGYNEIRYSHITGHPTLHAEASAILKLLKEGRMGDLAGSDLYVTRFTRAGRVGLSRPCPSCMALITSVGIRSVHYTTDGGGEATLRL